MTITANRRSQASIIFHLPNMGSFASLSATMIFLHFSSPSKFTQLDSSSYANYTYMNNH